MEGERRVIQFAFTALVGVLNADGKVQAIVPVQGSVCEAEFEKSFAEVAKKIETPAGN